MEDYTIVEKYQHTKKTSTIAIRPYFNPNKENMGLETYGLSLHGVTCMFRDERSEEVHYLIE